MINNEKIEELISAYAMGTLDGDELRDVEEYIQKNPEEAEKLLRESEIVFSNIPYIMKGASPRVDLIDKLIEEIREEKKNVEIPNKIPFWNSIQPRWVGIGGILAVALVIFLLSTTLTLMNSVNNKKIEITQSNKQITDQNSLIDNLEGKLASLENEIVSLNVKYASQKEITEFLNNPDVVIINLVNLQPHLKSVGRVLWNSEENDAIFYALNLPNVPTGKIYQLWVIADGQPKSAGVFNVDSRGNNHFKIKSLSNFGDISKFAVTLEPADGVPLPTGAMYLAGDA